MIKKHHSGWRRDNVNTHHLVRSSRGYSGCGMAFTRTKHRFGLSTFFRIWPSVNSYFRTLKAIEKLGDLSDQSKWTAGNNISNQTSYNNLTNQDSGFDDVVKLLRENRVLSGEVDELRLTKVIIPELLRSRANVPGGRTVWLAARKNGEEERMLIFDLRDSQRAIRELEEMAEKSVRRAIANLSGLLILLWLLVTTAVIVYTYVIQQLTQAGA